MDTEELTELSSDYETDEVSDLTLLKINITSGKVLKHSKTFIISSIVFFFLLSVVSLVLYFMNLSEEGLNFVDDTPEDVKRQFISISGSIDHYFELISIISVITFGFLSIFLLTCTFLSISEYVIYTVCMLIILAVSITITIFESKMIHSLRLINKNDMYLTFHYNNVNISYIIIGITLTTLMIAFSFAFLVAYLQIGYMHYNKNM